MNKNEHQHDIANPARAGRGLVVILRSLLHVGLAKGEIAVYRLAARKSGTVAASGTLYAIL